jgi:hypothetical protein
MSAETYILQLHDFGNEGTLGPVLNPLKTSKSKSKLLYDRRPVGQ